MRVTCPCCHGKKRLAVIINADEYTNVPPDMIAAIVTHETCCHCQGEGSIESEVSDETMTAASARLVPRYED